RADAVYEVQTLLPVLGDVDVVSRRTERGLHELSDHRIVLAEDDLAHVAASATAERASRRRGSVTWKTEPSPTVLSAQTVPPCSSPIRGSRRSERGCRGALGRRRSTDSVTMAFRSTGSRWSCMRPDSILSRSSISVIIRLSRWASLLMSPAYSRISANVRSSLCIISE